MILATGAARTFPITDLTSRQCQLLIQLCVRKETGAYDIQSIWYTTMIIKHVYELLLYTSGFFVENLSHIMDAFLIIG